MAKRSEIYKCQVCSHIVQVLHEGDGTLVCCDKSMLLMEPKTQEEGLTEKHLPVVEKSEKGILVKIGSVPHPMEEPHWIEWIRVLRKDGKACRQYLNPGDKPEAEFNIPLEEVDSVYEYCNLHGLWVTKM